jgi:hypothetical protein
VLFRSTICGSMVMGQQLRNQSGGPLAASYQQDNLAPGDSGTGKLA